MTLAEIVPSEKFAHSFMVPTTEKEIISAKIAGMTIGFF